MGWIDWMALSGAALALHLTLNLMRMRAIVQRVRALEARLNEPSTEDEP